EVVLACLPGCGEELLDVPGGGLLHTGEPAPRPASELVARGREWLAQGPGRTLLQRRAAEDPVDPAGLPDGGVRCGPVGRRRHRAVHRVADATRRSPDDRLRERSPVLAEGLERRLPLVVEGTEIIGLSPEIRLQLRRFLAPAAGVRLPHRLEGLAR